MGGVSGKVKPGVGAGAARSALPAGNSADTLPPDAIRRRASGVYPKPNAATKHDALAALVEDFRNGSRRAETELVRRLRAPLNRFLRGLVSSPEDRADVLQESLVALTAALREFRGDSSVVHFAIQVAKRLANATRRAHRRERNGVARAAQLELPLVDFRDGPHESALNRRRREELTTFLAVLPSVQAEAVLLRIVGAHSLAEVAKITGVPESTVRTRLRRAQKKLRGLAQANDALLDLLLP